MTQSQQLVTLHTAVICSNVLLTHQKSAFVQRIHRMRRDLFLDHSEIPFRRNVRAYGRLLLIHQGHARLHFGRLKSVLLRRILAILIDLYTAKVRYLYLWRR